MSDHLNPEIQFDENQLIAERREKLKLLRQREADGLGPAFPNDFKPSHQAGALAAAHAAHGAEELIYRDMEFHGEIAAATGNASLCSILEGIFTRGLRARVWRASLSGVKAMTLSEHGHILDALADRDPVLAAAAATLHLSESEKWLRQYLDLNVGLKKS